MNRTTFLIAIILSLYVPLALLDYAHFPYSDGAEHGAAVRELAKNLLHPADPMLANHPGNSPRFVPSTLAMSLVMRAVGCDVLSTLKFFLILYFILFLISAALFTREYFNDAGQIPWTITFLLFLWGTGWTGANAYMFSAILYTAYFPSLVAFSLSFLALFFQLRFIHTKRKVLLIIQILLCSLTFVNHPPTGIFYFICSALLYIERGTPGKKATLYYGISLVAALVLAVLWQYYSFFQNFVTIASGKLAHTPDYQLTRHYLYSKLVIRSGPALLGIPFILYLAVRKRYFLLVGGFLIFSFIYSMGYLLRISLAERYVFFIMTMLQITLSRSAREWFPSLFALNPNIKKITGTVIASVLALGLVIQSLLTYNQFISPAFSFTSLKPFFNYTSPLKMQRTLRQYLKAGDIVLSDLYTSWSIPVFTGAKIIALYHTPPHVLDNRERIQDLETFFKTSTSNNERKYILKKYRVTHVLIHVPITGNEIELDLVKMGLKKIALGRTFCIYSVP